MQYDVGVFAIKNSLKTVSIEIKDHSFVIRQHMYIGQSHTLQRTKKSGPGIFDPLDRGQQQIWPLQIKTDPQKIRCRVIKMKNEFFFEVGETGLQNRPGQCFFYFGDLSFEDKVITMHVCVLQ